MSRRKSRKRPCRICRKWFTPDPRVGDRQKTCGNPECRQKWHNKKCAEWNRQNSKCAQESYLHNKLIDTINQSKDNERRDIAVINSKPPPHFAGTAKFPRLPRAFIQEVIGTQHLVIIEYISQQLLRAVQEVIRRQPPDNSRDPKQLLQGGVQEVIRHPRRDRVL